MAAKRVGNGTALSPAEEITLAALWLADNPRLSTAAIGLKMNRSKNSIVGHAARIGLPHRPSPIKRSTDPGFVPAPPRRRVKVGTAIPLPAVSTDTVQPVEAQVPTPSAPPVRVPPHPMPDLPGDDDADDAPEPLRSAPRPVRMAECCWPIGTPGTKAFRFCEESTPRGKNYCDTHTKQAFVRVRDRREDAARVPR